MKEKLIIIILTITTIISVSYSIKIKKEYSHNIDNIKKITEDLKRNEEDLKRNASKIKELQDRQDVKFLRMVTEATFYKGNEIEIWRMMSKK